MSDWYQKGCVVFGGQGDDKDLDDADLIKMWDDSMASFKEEMEARKRGETTKKKWVEGEFCRAMYEPDGCWYEARIKQKLPDGRLWVEYLGYEDEKELESYMIKLSKGEKARQAQIQECELEEYEDEYYTGEESEEEEQQLVVTKEECENKDLQKKNSSSKEDGDLLHKFSILDPFKPVGNDEMSGSKKKSSQNRKSKATGRSTAQPYPVPSDNGFEPFPDRQEHGHRARDTGSPAYRNDGLMETHGGYVPPRPSHRPRPSSASSNTQYRTVVVPDSEPPFYRIEKHPIPPPPSRPVEPYSALGEYEHRMHHHDPTTLPFPPPPQHPLLRREPTSSRLGHALPPNLSGHKDYGQSRGYPSTSFLPRFVPPPPPLPDVPDSTPETQSLMSMLNAWYVSGYQTGYYMGLKESQQRMRVDRGSRSNS